MDVLEFFKKMRDTANEVIKAVESEDEKAMNIALGQFALLMIQADCIK